MEVGCRCPASRCAGWKGTTPFRVAPIGYACWIRGSLSRSATHARVVCTRADLCCDFGVIVSSRPSLQSIDAHALAEQLLGSCRTRLGGLHIDHARRVAAAAGDDPRVIAVALLHDVVEKADVTVDQLRDLVGDAWIVDLVAILTMPEGEDEETYLVRCASDPVAIRIKRLDLVDKLVTDDVHVPADVAASIRSEALSRLRTLNGLASGTH